MELCNTPHSRALSRRAASFCTVVAVVVDFLTSGGVEDASNRFTPVALAIPTAMAIEFDISWSTDNPWSDIVGDGCK